MDSRKYVLKETAVIGLGQIICTGVMFGVFALLSRFDSSVLLGGIIGALVAVLNFFFMAVGTSLAADRAEAQNVNGGKALISISYLIRLAAMFLILFLCAKSGRCNVFALVLPLVFTRPILMVSEFFRKKGDVNS